MAEKTKAIGVSERTKTCKMLVVAGIASLALAFPGSSTAQYKTDVMKVIVTGEVVSFDRTHEARYSETVVIKDGAKDSMLATTLVRYELPGALNPVEVELESKIAASNSLQRMILSEMQADSNFTVSSGTVYKYDIPFKNNEGSYENNILKTSETMILIKHRALPEESYNKIIGFLIEEEKKESLSALLRLECRIAK